MINWRCFQLMKIDPRAVPTAAREFSRSERVFVRILTYGTGAAAPTLSARLLNRTGQPVADLPLTAGAGGNDNSHDIDLTLSSLPAGEYLVEVTATGPAAPAKELVGFRITS